MEAVTDEQLAAGEKAMGPELSYLLSDRGVAKRTRGLIGHMGIHRMNVFAKIETNETEFRAWAKDSLGLNPAAEPAARIALAILVDAWEASKNRITKQSELEAEARVLGIPNQSLKGTQLQLRKAYVQAFGPLPDKYCPSRTCVDWRLEHLEEGELRPEKLRQVTTVEDEDNDGEDGGTLDIAKEEHPLQEGPDERRASQYAGGPSQVCSRHGGPLGVRPPEGSYQDLPPRPRHGPLERLRRVPLGR